MSRRGRPAGPASLRVVAGSHHGRRIEAPEGHGTRPTADRVRQAVFNALDSLGAIEGARVVDGFAGSGALGIEALSRGAAHVIFAETDAGARRVVEQNLRTLGLQDRAEVTARPFARVVASLAPVDLVLLDPPYAEDRWDEIWDGVVGVLAPDAIVVVESDREVPLPAGLRGIRSKAYGGTVVQFATPSGVPS